MESEVGRQVSSFGVLTHCSDLERWEPKLFKVLQSFLSAEEISSLRLMGDENEYESLFQEPGKSQEIGWINLFDCSRISVRRLSVSILMSITEVPDLKWNARFVEELEEYVGLTAERKADLRTGFSLNEEEEIGWNELREDIALRSWFIDVCGDPAENSPLEINVYLSGGNFTDPLLNVGPVLTRDLAARLVAYLSSQWYGWTDEFFLEENADRSALEDFYRYLPLEKKMSF